MAATDLVFGGLYHLSGQTVGVCIAGIYCGQFVVSSDGFVTVPINSDPQGLCNGTYLQQYDVGPWNKTAYGDTTSGVTLTIPGVGEATIYIPVVIGMVYAAAGAINRPVTEGQTKSQQGPGMGKNHQTYNYAAMVSATQALQIGTNLTNTVPMQLQNLNGATLNENVLFTGVAFGSLMDSMGTDGQLTWLQQFPYPCTINTLTSFIDTEERS